MAWDTKSRGNLSTNQARILHDRREEEIKKPAPNSWRTLEIATLDTALIIPSRPWVQKSPASRIAPCNVGH
jgi:hypothetical protein